jgi:hypothetical protein
MTSQTPVTDQLRRIWFLSVYELSNIDLQRRTWLDHTNTNPHWSYVEFIEVYPDREQLSDALQHGWLSQREFEVLSELRKLLEAHTPPSRDYYDHDAILADPAWQAIVDAAERARQHLLTMTTDRQERNMLLGCA